MIFFLEKSIKDQFSKVYLSYFEPLPTQNERSDIECQIITIKMECIRIANARHKVIIFCKSHPLNWQLECILKTITTKQNRANRLTTMTARLHDTSLKGAFLFKVPAHYNNKYVLFYSLWPCFFILS